MCNLLYYERGTKKSCGINWVDSIKWPRKLSINPVVGQNIQKIVDSSKQESTIRLCIDVGALYLKKFPTLKTRRELEQKCAPQLFLALLLGMGWSVIGRSRPRTVTRTTFNFKFSRLFSKIDSPESFNVLFLTTKVNRLFSFEGG